MGGGGIFSLLNKKQTQKPPAKAFLILHKNGRINGLGEHSIDIEVKKLLLVLLHRFLVVLLGKSEISQELGVHLIAKK